jgi:hypothetical protein
MPKGLFATLATVLVACPAPARSASEPNSVKAATDCVARAALNNPNIVQFYQEDLHSDACGDALRAMRLLHDPI